jgi:hypothetical protein
VVLFLGKFGQRNDNFSRACYPTSQDEVEELMLSGAEITNIYKMNEVCQLQVKQEQTRMNPKCQYIILSWVTALSRIDMHKHFMNLASQDGIKLFFTDTDSLCISARKGVKPNIPIGLCFGDFKPEFGSDCHITSFTALGKKSTCVTYLQNGITKSKTKTSGLGLDPNLAAQSFTPSVFASFLKNFIDGKKISTFVPQMRKKMDLQTGKLVYQPQTHELTNSIACQRKIDMADANLKTSPWGYC